MMSSEPAVQRFADADMLVRELAHQVADTLQTAIDVRGLASLVISGGKSPVKLFEILRTQLIDWSRVCIALVDERWVAGDDPSSNEKLAKDFLLRDKAAAARFYGLKNAAATPAAGAQAAWEAYGPIPKPFDTVILGMGDDGHTASLFPGSPNLAEGLDTSRKPGCIGMTAPTAPQQRMSLNLSALLESRRLVLFISGEAKWRTYVQATESGPVNAMPIRAVLRQQRTPTDVFWSP